MSSSLNSDVKNVIFIQKYTYFISFTLCFPDVAVAFIAMYTQNVFQVQWFDLLYTKTAPFPI